MSLGPEAFVPRLHLSLRDTRRELDRMTDLARQLAVALDREVDARLGTAPVNRRRSADALFEARVAGLLND